MFSRLFSPALKAVPSNLEEFSRRGEIATPLSLVDTRKTLGLREHLMRRRNRPESRTAELKRGIKVCRAYRENINGV